MGKYLYILIFCALPSMVWGQLIFTPDNHDFGTISEERGSVSHTFTGVNRGDTPVVILDIYTSCGCTMPQFSKKPIMPGEKTAIKITYDPYNRPGFFEKNIDIYTVGQRKLATLLISGDVTPRPKSIEELYAIDAGGGLRLERNYAVQGYVEQGGRVQFAIGYANTSKQPIRVELRPEVSSGVLTAHYPSIIAAGERGEINFIYQIPVEKPLYGSLRDVFKVYVDNRSNGTLITTEAIGIDKPAKESVGRLKIDEYIVKFGTVKRSAPKQKRIFTLKNEGEGELIIRSVETGGKFGTTLTAGSRIAAGRSFTAEATLDPKSQDWGAITDVIMIITNDPSRPMWRLRVSAIIEE